MLTALKRAIQYEKEMDIVAEATVGSTEDFVKGLFLDSIDVDVLGAENDPEIKSLVNSLPEYDSHDENLASELGIKSLTESLLIETEL